MAMNSPSMVYSFALYIGGGNGLARTSFLRSASATDLIPSLSSVSAADSNREPAEGPARSSSVRS